MSLSVTSLSVTNSNAVNSNTASLNTANSVVDAGSLIYHRCSNEVLWASPATSYYTVLAVPPNVDAGTLKRMYRQWQMYQHTHPGIDVSKYTMVERIFSTLSDPSMRSKYDGDLTCNLTTSNLVASNLATNRKSSPLISNVVALTPEPERIPPEPSRDAPVYHTWTTITLEQAYFGGTVSAVVPGRPNVAFDLLPGTISGQTYTHLGVTLHVLIQNSDRWSCVGNDLWYKMPVDAKETTLVVPHPSGKTIRVKSLDQIDAPFFTVPGFGINSRGNLCIILKHTDHLFSAKN